jgi:hypothetical protein
MTYTQLPENSADVFRNLVAKFRPTPYDAKKKDISTNPDTIIGVRIRPLSPEEIESNDACAVLPRPRTDNVVDLHELKMGVRSGPKLDVCLQSYSIESTVPEIRIFFEVLIL